MCVFYLEMARPCQRGASQSAGLSLTLELHTCPGSAQKHIHVNTSSSYISFVKNAVFKPQTKCFTGRKKNNKFENTLSTDRCVISTLKEGSAFTLWWDSIFIRRGGIMLTASCRLMLPCKDKHKNNARLFISLTTSDILFSLCFFNYLSRGTFWEQSQYTNLQPSYHKFTFCLVCV